VGAAEGRPQGCPPGRPECGRGADRNAGRDELPRQRFPAWAWVWPCVVPPRTV